MNLNISNGLKRLLIMSPKFAAHLRHYTLGFCPYDLNFCVVQHRKKSEQYMER